MAGLPGWINLPAILIVAGLIFVLFIYKLAITIAAKAGKADHDNAFKQSAVGLISLFWFAVASIGIGAVTLIGIGLYDIVINSNPAP